jgi:hypothetical protein
MILKNKPVIKVPFDINSNFNVPQTVYRVDELGICSAYDYIM